uniref:protein NLP6-like n=1 Tax=Erigeron canadensis TaxID=72917 RepID=UPI001CB90E5E|nr:protein NLP6-like [Erigeron canadensis]
MELSGCQSAISSNDPEPTQSHSSIIKSCLEYPSGSSIGKETFFIGPHYKSVNTTNGFKNRVEHVVGCHEEVKDKIQKALTSLTLRNQCNLVQFWSPCSDGKYKLLKTVDQPFVFGIPDEGLCSYRRESERNWFPVDQKCEEEELVPVARVFKRQLPEWTSDVMNYCSKNYPLQDSAMRLNLHGYLVLPVFDSFTMLCVGVLELITSLKHLDCAYEVQEIHRSLKAVNLTSAQPFNCPTSYVNYENRQPELDEIFTILKDVCDTYKLPLAQTWTVSSWSSFVAAGKKIETACSSFNSSCIGKVCLSATALPFNVHDLRFWNFREACRERHLLKSQGVVGWALSSRGSSFCADVTELGEAEYPLVHNARMNGLRSCFAIYLNSREHDHNYVLEFFLPVHMKEDADLQNMIQKLKMHVKLSSNFQCGDQLCTELFGRPMELNSEDLQMIGGTNAQTDCISFQDPCHFTRVYHKNLSSVITNTQKMSVNNDVISQKADGATKDKGYNSEEKEVSIKKSSELKTDSLTLDHNIQKYIGKSTEHKQKFSGKEIDEVSWSFGPLSKIRELDSETAWETQTETDYTKAQDQHEFINSCDRNWNSAITNCEDMAVNNVISEKTVVASVVNGYISGIKGPCTKHKRRRKMDYVTPQTIRQYFGMPIGEASRSLGVSRSTLKRVCRELSIPRWPFPQRNKKYGSFGIYTAVLLLIGVKRWSCSSGRHGFSAKWWICGKHKALAFKSNPSDESETVNPFSKPHQTCIGIYEAAYLLLGLKRWRKRTVVKHAMPCNDYIIDGQISNIINIVDVSPKMNVVNYSDTSMVTVKATYRDDTVKFKFPLSSGLLKLKDQVAQRIKLQTTRFHLKYRDEDDDLILLACDEDFCNLMPFSVTSATDATIRLIVQIADD